jgi:thiol-disulfide isomerase/thioredoxin
MYTAQRRIAGNKHLYSFAIGYSSKLVEIASVGDVVAKVNLIYVSLFLNVSASIGGKGIYLSFYIYTIKSLNMKMSALMPLSLKSFLFTCFFFLTTVVVAQDTSKGIKFTEGSLADLMKLSAAENKLIFIDAFTTWCGPCKRMAKDVFPDSTVGAFYNANFINAKIDMEKGEGLEIASKYEVNSYPTYLYLNAGGEIVHRSGGSKPAVDFIEDGKNAINPEMNLVALRKNVSVNTDQPELLYKYLQMNEQANQAADPAIRQHAFDLITEENLNDPWRLKTVLFMGPGLMGLKKVESLSAALSKIIGEDSLQSILAIYGQYKIYEAADAENKEDYPEFKRILSGFKLTKISSEELAKSIWEHDLMYHKKWKDTDAYIGLAKSGVKKYYWNETNYLNTLAWDIFEMTDNKADLTIADSWAARSIELNESYYNLDTRAWIQYKLGNKDLALNLANKAIEKGKLEQEDISGTEDLLKKLK